MRAVAAAFEDAARRRLLLGGLCMAVAIAFTVRGLGDEGYLYTQGDSPRYIMNAAFMLDLVRDHPFGSLSALREYATLYYARYPALSLGHHPPLASMLEVPFFAVMGTTITAARLPIILSFAIGVWYLFRLVTDLYDEAAGTFAALAMAMSPGMVQISQGVMSEPPTLALMIAAAYYLHRFCETERRGPLVAFVACASASVWAKQIAAVAFPAFILYAIARLGWRRLLRRDVIAASAVLAVLAGSMLAVSAAVSTVNVQRALLLVRPGASPPVPDQANPSRPNALRIMGEVIARTPAAATVHLTEGVLAASLIGLVVLSVRRRPEAWLFVPWVLGTLLFVAAITRFQELWRYSVYWIPPLAASAGTLGARGRWQGLLAPLLTIVLAAELFTALQMRIVGAGGYEEAAQYVTEHPLGSTVMFSGDVDTGYFVFFVRKHDPGRQRIVLRSDKVFTTSNMKSVAAFDQITSPAEIAPTLRRLGVGYVVIEDRQSFSKVQEWLRTELRGQNYVERLRVPFVSRDPRLRGTSLAVYEVKGVGAGDPEARLDMRLPIVSQELDVRLGDLVARKGLPQARP